MNYKSNAIWIFLCIMPLIGLAQQSVISSDQLTESTPEHTKFIMLLDTINKYMYRDIEITEQGMNECLAIIESENELHDSLLYEYHLQEIYFHHVQTSPVNAYEVILDHQQLFEQKSISQKLSTTYKYLKAFTLMAIGDYESAQNSYYENIESAKSNLDTNTIIMNMYSLGQVFNDHQKFQDAIDCYNTVFEYIKVFPGKPTTTVLCHAELAESYIEDGQYEKGLEILKKGYAHAYENDMKVIVSDLMYLEGGIYLKQKNKELAAAHYQKLLDLNIGEGDVNNTLNTKFFNAELLELQDKNQDALVAYSDLFNHIHPEDLNNQSLTYESLQRVASKLGKHEMAYNYLQDYNAVEQKMDEDSKRQQTAYLKIKYDYEQQEKDNSILAAEIKSKDAERNLLTSLFAILGLVFLILYVLYSQKVRYNKLLESEVEKRTQKLKTSNDQLNLINNELDEFNRMLAHDLKEPIRNIISFNQLAMKESKVDSKMQEYLSIVKKSGYQLKQLIQGVADLKDSKQLKVNENDHVHLEEMILDIKKEVEQSYPSKLIQIKTEVPKNVSAPRACMNSIFLQLIDNATKFNHNDMVNIDIRYTERDGSHSFTLKDNGIGIPEAYQTKVFSMFNRLNSRSEFEGSGLGLSAIQKIIEKLNGQIQIKHSKPKEGTTFQFDFPKFNN